MNQKKKIIIIIGATSFLGGTSIIFLTLRNNQHQKNNLVIKKERKQKKEHSVLFWIVLTIEIFIILTIITKYIYNLYQYLKTPEEKPDTNEDQEKQKEKTKEQKTKTKYLNQETVSRRSSQKSFSPEKPPEKKRQSLSEKQKQLLIGKQCFITYLNKDGISIKLTPDKKPKEKVIDDILKEDIDGQTLPNSLNPDFYQQAQNVDLFKNSLQKMIDFLKKYITVQLLEDVYNDQNEYGLLTTMAINMIKYINCDYTHLHTEHFFEDQNNNEGEEQKLIFKGEKQEVNDDVINFIQNKNYQSFLKTILQNDKVLFIKDEINNEEHYLLPNLFGVFKFVNKFYSCLTSFFQQYSEKYKDQLSELDQDLKDLNFFNNDLNN